MSEEAVKSAEAREPQTNGLTTIGLDLGGTKILALALELPSGEIVARRKVATPRHAAATVETLYEATMVVATDLGYLPNAVGVGAAGLIDIDGFIRTSPNLPDIDNLSLREPLAARLGVPVALDNDATAAAVAEARLGAAKDSRNSLYVAFGTGIGGGLVINGQVYRGAHGFAAEVGHMVVDPNGPICGCGQKGCWEQLASGNALGRLGRQAFLEGHLKLAGGSERLTNTEITGELVGREALAGNTTALELLGIFSAEIARGLANLTNVFDPEIIVVGGGVMELGEILLAPVRDHFQNLPMGAQHRPRVPIMHAHFGEDAGAIGAALLAAELCELA